MGGKGGASGKVPAPATPKALSAANSSDGSDGGGTDESDEDTDGDSQQAGLEYHLRHRAKYSLSAVFGRWRSLRPQACVRRQIEKEEATGKDADEIDQEEEEADEDDAEHTVASARARKQWRVQKFIFYRWIAALLDLELAPTAPSIAG